MIQLSQSLRMMFQYYPVAMIIVHLGIYFVLIYGIKMGKNWAQLACTIFLGFGLILNLKELLAWWPRAIQKDAWLVAPYVASFNVTLDVLFLLALLLLFSERSNAWFKEFRA